MTKFYTSVSRSGNFILARGYVDGKRFFKKEKYRPYLFAQDNSNGSIEYRTIFGNPVKRINFDSMKESSDFIKQYSDVNNFKIYGFEKYIYTYIYDNYKKELHVTLNDLSVGAIDIEVAKDEDGFADVKIADKPVTAITIKRKNTIISFGCKEYDAPEGVIYVQCKDEETLLIKFLKTWEYLDLDIVTGWNIKNYDIPYLIRRIMRVLGEEHAKRLSPWKMLDIVRSEFNGKVEEVPTPKGIEVLDYLELYRKFTYVKRESYTLNYISFIEIGEEKIDYSEYTDLQELYDLNFQKFMDYNIKDVVLIDKLEEKLGLIALAITFAYDAKINISDVFGTVRPWDVIIHNYLMDRKVVIPQYVHTEKKDQFAGAYVKDTKVGSHEWVVSFDVASLYPSLMVQYNMSPETIRRKLNMNVLSMVLKNEIVSIDDNVCIAANGLTFDKEYKGFIPDIVEKYLKDRKVYKKKMQEAKKDYEETKSPESADRIARYHNLQLARKIQVNTLYGSIGNQYSRWFNINYAEAITLSGQMVLKYLEKYLNNYLNSISGKNKDYIIAGDTDSVYLTLGDFGNTVDEIDEFCQKKIQPQLDKFFKEIAKNTNAYTNFVSMKREAIASRGIFIAKKNYILLVWDNEGLRYKKPELKMMGISAIRSSTPSSCRDAIKKAINIIMTENNDSLIKFISGFEKEFRSLPFTDIAFPRGVNNIEKFYNSATLWQKSTPIQVRGSILYNKLIKDMNLDKKHPRINSGDKIKFVYLKLPNPLHQDVICVPTTLHSEFGLDKYVDYETQFNKAFLKSIKSITDLIGWETEYVNTLEKYFAK